MKVLYKERILNKEAFALPFDNRAWRYGDGFFETMRLVNGHVYHLEHHWNRMNKAMKVLGLMWQDQYQWANFCKHIDLLVEKSSLSEGNIKVYVWRSGAGKYTPQTDLADFCMSIEPLSQKPANTMISRAGFCTTVHNVHSLYSGFKKLSSIHYVLAAREMKIKEWQEIIILDVEGHISEALASNIFWCIDGKLYTPDLSTGCVEGTFRSGFLNYAQEQGWRIEEVKAKPEVLRQAQHVFTTNANGVRHFEQIGDNTFSVYQQASDYMKIIQAN